ncbi:hypothetical protein BBW65_04225 [Helicobacter enhydrae]|uniref:Damage-control phosphatase ARMT1-like metal-binding domain-containing protein n=1 Tax=Helicobacter enhydrae TaxID=222136 RepID=A0A1B1U5M0_9HELI|nr:ARMT1-like domain-containing protein [Helicobacter enhydrae]ANV98056.1 hypothetical protein BBW65_04225 [Helicobacter enhydrae]
MKAKKECFSCLLNQARVWSEDVAGYQKLLDSVVRDESGASLWLSPPQIAIDLYGKIAKECQSKDLYQTIKQECIAKASALLKRFHTEDLSLEEAVRLCALGNVIDYGSASAFDIDSFDFASTLGQLDFCIFEFEAFVENIKRAKSLVVLGDNAGENLFDELLIQRLKREFENLDIYYFVRGAPIINDVTLADLDSQECRGIFDIAEVVDSGVRSPGFVYEDATPKAQKIYDTADVVLSKGMGNFECLESMQDARVFFLLKIKCNVVAEVLGEPLGKMVLKQNTNQRR